MKLEEANPATLFVPDFLMSNLEILGFYKIALQQIDALNSVEKGYVMGHTSIPESVAFYSRRRPILVEFIKNFEKYFEDGMGA